MSLVVFWETPCTRCGRDTKVTNKSRKHNVLCKSCQHETKPKELCGSCGGMEPIANVIDGVRVCRPCAWKLRKTTCPRCGNAAKSRSDGGVSCQKCDATGVCAECQTEALVFLYKPLGVKVCRPCSGGLKGLAPCVSCGKDTVKHAKRGDGYICGTCRSSERVGLCSECGEVGTLPSKSNDVCTSCRGKARQKQPCVECGAKRRCDYNKPGVGLVCYKCAGKEAKGLCNTCGKEDHLRVNPETGARVCHLCNFITCPSCEAKTRLHCPGPDGVSVCKKCFRQKCTRCQMVKSIYRGKRTGNPLCYQCHVDTLPILVCSICNLRGQHRFRDPQKAPVCHNCYRDHVKERAPCTSCGLNRIVTYRDPETGGVFCMDCRYKQLGRIVPLYYRNRQALLERGDLCYVCGGADHLVTHHITPVKRAASMGWPPEKTHDPTNLVVLCRRHHVGKNGIHNNRFADWLSLLDRPADPVEGEYTHAQVAQYINDHPGPYRSAT
jgi:hypothetical protein